MSAADRPQGPPADADFGGETGLVPKEYVRPTGLGNPDNLPKIGDWFWVEVDAEEGHDYDTVFTVRGNRVTKTKRVRKGSKKKPQALRVEKLMCVEHVASNHIVYGYYEGEYGHSEQLSFADALKYARPAPEWREVLNQRMEDVRAEMERQTRLLQDEGIKANALPPANKQFVPTVENPMALAVRVLDVDKEKRALVNLQKRIPEVTATIGKLAKQQVGITQMMVLPEMSQLAATKKRLAIVEDKIFTLEVYAGLQEHVKQIADGDAAPPATKITVRQSLLFMDEETLFDYKSGGMDYEKLSDFDKWVVRPENLNRLLPEPRGIVAMRVRRGRKDRGEVHSIAEAWVRMGMDEADMETYLLLRNGQRVYRIASDVDFSPRLIPLADEFQDAFVQRQERYGGFGQPDIVTTERITPKDFEYDQHAEALRNNLKHYNRVVVLLQGLLDRSEVFHPHPAINLAEEADMLNWLNLVRDEEGALGAGTLSETWEQYRDRLNGWIKAGSYIYQRYPDLRRRPWNTKECPSIVQVKRVRLGKKSDIIPEGNYNYAAHRREHYGRPEKECVGLLGVDVEWDGGTVERRSRYARWRGLAGEEKPYTGHMWIPITAVFNVSEYLLGDYKKFLCDRAQKGKYLQWAAPLLSAEDWHRNRAEQQHAPTNRKKSKQHRAKRI